MIRLLRGTLARLLALGVLALVLLAVLISAARLTLPLLDQYREPFAAALSERLGYPLRMGGMSLHLSGWSPRLALDDVVLADPEGGPDLLSLRALELDLDLPASLRLGSPQIRALTLVGARLALRRLADGRIRVLGLGALQSDDPRTLELFLRQGRLNLVDSEVVLIDDRIPGGLPWLTQVQLGLRNAGQGHRLDLRARPVADRLGDSDRGDPSDARLQVLAELRGDGLDPSTWGGSVYLKLSGAGTLDLAPPDILAHARAQGLVLEAWLQLSAGGLTEGLGRVALEGLRLTPSRLDLGPSAEAEGAEPTRAQPGARPIAVDRLSALARVVPTTEGWRIGVRDLWLAMEGGELEGLNLDLRLSGRGRLDGLQLAVDNLDLALVPPLVRLIPGPRPELAQRLDDLAPEGHLKRIGFALERPVGTPPRWRLAATGNGLGIHQSGKVPGVEGLCLRLRADQDGGDLRLRSEWLQLDLAPLFDRPIYLDRFSGLLDWTLGPAGALHLSGRNLVLENPDLGGRVRFDLDLPAPGGGRSPFLDLRASLHDGDGARARTYIPVGILHPKLVGWLERALVGGRVPQADLIFRGPLRDYPFRGNDGRFELLLEIEDAGLDYLEGWPPLESASGTLRFLNQGMAVQVDSARILDSALGDGRAVMADLRGPHHLSIQGQVEGPFSDGLRVLAETPLARRLGVLPRVLQVGGVSRLDLGLELPLAQGQPPSLAGRLTWPGQAEISLQGTPLTLTDLAGELRFTEHSVSAEGIAAQLWGRPLSLDVATGGPAGPAGPRTEIRARSRLPVSDLARRLPSPLWSIANGDADWDLGVEVGLADLTRDLSPLSWRLRSDLRGLALDLPAPLGKTANQARALDLAGALLPGRSLSLRGTVGQGTAGGLGLDLALTLTKGSPRLERGRIVAGAREAPAGAPEGLLVEADLPRLELTAWADWWSRFRGLGAGRGAGAGPGAIVLPRPLGLDLRIARLDLAGAALTDARVRAAPGDSGWTAEVESRELAGSLGFPAAGSDAPVAISLARLDLAALLPSGDRESPPTSPESAEDGTRLPPTDLRVADLRWGGAPLGRLAVDLRPEPGGLRIPRIDLKGPGDTRVSGEATSVDGPEGGRARLALDLESADTGPLMRALDYGSVLSEAPLESSVRLEWPGGLGSFALARSTGTLSLKVGAGRLLEVEPGVGRVLGILNLGALSRRLALDFTDIYQQGFSFEQIQGDIRIGGGKAELRRFEIEGPASAIRVSGYTDLRSRTFDQMVTVEPRIGSSVALASALAGGPVVGAAVYLADKVTGGTIDKLGSYSYRVTGPWSDPELTRVGWGPFGGDAPAGAPGETSGGDSGGTGPGAFPLPFSLPPSRSDENHFLN
jgi:uncharacterized protein (TIGR02099 family)